MLQIASYYAHRGGVSDGSTYCGSFCVVGSGAASSFYWGRGAALSFRLNTHYACRGGHSSNGTICGAFFVSPGLSVTDKTWHVGAALSFKLTQYFII